MSDFWGTSPEPEKKESPDAIPTDQPTASDRPPGPPASPDGGDGRDDYWDRMGSATSPRTPPSVPPQQSPAPFPPQRSTLSGPPRAPTPPRYSRPSSEKPTPERRNTLATIAFGVICLIPLTPFVEIVLAANIIEHSIRSRSANLFQSLWIVTLPATAVAFVALILATVARRQIAASDGTEAGYWLVRLTT
jgi:hypothetical protein